MVIKKDWLVILEYCAAVMAVQDAAN